MFNETGATATDRDAKLTELKEIIREAAGQFDSVEFLLKNDEALLAVANRIASVVRDYGMFERDEAPEDSRSVHDAA